MSVVYLHARYILQVCSGVHLLFIYDRTIERIEGERGKECRHHESGKRWKRLLLGVGVHPYLQCT